MRQFRSRLMPNERLVRRRNRRIGQYGDDGMPLDDAWEESTIVCNCQPITGDERTLDPQGNGYKEEYWLWTTSKDLQNDDVIIRNGKEFQVLVEQDWRQQHLQHIQCRIVRRDV